MKQQVLDVWSIVVGEIEYIEKGELKSMSKPLLMAKTGNRKVWQMRQTEKTPEHDPYGKPVLRYTMEQAKTMERVIRQQEWIETDNWVEWQPLDAVKT